MRVLGVNSIGNDHAIFLIDLIKEDIFAISLERITRIKHDKKGIEIILREYAEELSNIDLVCFASEGDSDTNSVGRSLLYSLANKMDLYKRFKPEFVREEKELLQRVNAAPLRTLGPKLFLQRQANKIRARFYRGEADHAAIERYLKGFGQLNSATVRFFDHHQCHAASAYYSSPFSRDDAVVVVTIDGFGDGYFSKVFQCQQDTMTLISGSQTSRIVGATTELKFFSLGALYANFTEAMGLQINSEEGKVEALAAYGAADSKLFDDLSNSVEIEGLTINPSSGIEKFYSLEYLKTMREVVGDENFCASIQKFLDETVVRYLSSVKTTVGGDRLCLAGGVTANVITNLRIFESNLFDDIFVYPAMADDGTAAGAALLGAVGMDKSVTAWLKKKQMPYWGDDIASYDIEAALESSRHLVDFEENPDWHTVVAEKLHSGEVGALVQGRMEFGPRALGNRSIVASPLIEGIRDRINSDIKRRPAYQPFCPSVMDEERERLFESSAPNRHMTSAYRLKPEYRRIMPAAVHVDLTGRPQFCRQEDNPSFHRLLSAFKELTDYGILINTSYNKHGRTIVRTPHDALQDFLDCSLDFLVLDRYLVTKK